MAIIYGPNKIVGTAGGLRHYRMNNSDEIYVAGLGGANRELILHNPAFARTRENMSEMTPRSKMAKEIKIAFGQCSAPIVNRYLIGELNAALRKVQLMDQEGERGCRSVYLSKNREQLNYLKYYYYKPFSDIMKCSYTVETAPDRKSVSVNLANLTPCDQIKPPGTATHFQFFLSIGVVCDMVFSPEYCDFKLAYGPPQFYGKGREIESEWIPVDAQAMGDITLTVAIPDAFNLKEDMTVLRMFGIVFGRMTSRVDPIAKDRGSCEFLGAI